MRSAFPRDRRRCRRIVKLSRQLRLTNGAFDLRVALVEQHRRNNRDKKDTRRHEKLDDAMATERVGITTVYAVVSLGVGKTTAIALRHVENVNKNTGRADRQGGRAG